MIWVRIPCLCGPGRLPCSSDVADIMNRILCIKPTRLKRGNVLDDNNGSYRPVIGVIGGEAEFHSSVSGYLLAGQLQKRPIYGSAAFSRCVHPSLSEPLSQQRDGVQKVLTIPIKLIGMIGIPYPVETN